VAQCLSTLMQSLVGPHNCKLKLLNLETNVY